MTKESMETGRRLLDAIEKTTKAIDKLRAVLKDPKRHNTETKDIYNMTVCEHSDGSGWKLDLARYWGNEELLHVILKALDAQLEDLEKRFKAT